MGIKVERIRERIKAECARVIMTELRDPRGGFVTVQNVELSADLRNAKVFVSILGEEPERRRIMRMLEDARGFIQRAVAAVLRTRVTPTLRFVLDTSIDKSFKVAAILEQIKKEKPPAAEGASPLEISDDLGGESDHEEDEEEDEDEDEGEDEGEAEEAAPPPPKKKEKGGRGLRGKKKAKARREDEEDLEDDAGDADDDE